MTRAFAKAVVAIAVLGLLSSTALAAPDLYMKDTGADAGIEPNPDTGPHVDLRTHLGPVVAAPQCGVVLLHQRMRSANHVLAPTTVAC